MEIIQNISRSTGENKEEDTGNGSDGGRYIFKNNEWIKKSPFEDKNCYHCRYLAAYVTLWCENKACCAARGNSKPGVYHCTFWEPNFKEIQDKWLTDEQLLLKHPLKPKNVLTRIKQWLKGG